MNTADTQFVADWLAQSLAATTAFAADAEATATLGAPAMAAAPPTPSTSPPSSSRA